MDFELSEQHKMVRDLMRDFVKKEVTPEVVRKFEEKEEFPKELVRKLGERGFMGIFVPEEYGGFGIDILSYAIAEEELARVWASLGLIMSANNSLSIYPILKFGDERQKRKYLFSLAKGRFLGCLALTEPEAGSDLTSIRTFADKDGPYWRISGGKTLITNASEAQICVLVARTGKDPHKGLTAFIIETNSPGFQAGKPEKKMGLLCSPTCGIVLDDCLVSQENILGNIGDGFTIALETLFAGRINIGAQALGIAQGAFDLALAYTKERKQFGRPISGFQNVQFKLADMAIGIETARNLVYKAAWLKDKGVPFAKEASMAKTYASEMAVEVVKSALRLHGGYGYLKSLDIERYYRDVIVTTIYEGDNDSVQRPNIAKYELGIYK